MPDLELSMSVVHRIELAFEFEPQLDFFLVVLSVLHVLFFKLESLMLLLGTVLLQLVIVVSQCLHVLIEHLLFVDESLNLFFESFFNRHQLTLMLVRDLCNQDPIVCLAAVL